MKNNIIITLLFLCSYSYASGSGKDSTFTLLSKRSAAGLQLSSFGAGLGFHSSLPKHPRLAFDLNYTFLRFVKSKEFTVRGDSRVNILPDINHQMISGFVSYYPFKKTRFYGKAGTGYNFGQKYQAQITSPTGLELGGIEIAGEDFGTIDLSVKWNKLMPYLGVGYLKSFPKNRLSLGFDAGCFYMGSPKIKTDFEGFLESTTLDTKIVTIEENMKNYSFYPFLSLNLSYSLFKK